MKHKTKIGTSRISRTAYGPFRCYRSEIEGVLGGGSGSANGVSEAVTDLIEKLGSESANLRRQAATELGRLKESHSTKANSQATISALAGKMKDSDFNVRYCVASSLGRFDDDLAVRTLVDALDDINDLVFKSVFGALIEQKEKAVPLLKNLRDNGDQRMSTRATEVLRKIQTITQPYV